MRTMTNGMVALALASVGMIPMGHGVQGSATVRPAVRKASATISRGTPPARAHSPKRSIPTRSSSSTATGSSGQLTSAEYIARAAGKPADDEAQRSGGSIVDVTGDAAVAKITLEYPGVTLTDYMSLIKVDGEWRIVNKIFPRESAGDQIRLGRWARLSFWQLQTFGCRAACSR